MYESTKPIESWRTRLARWRFNCFPAYRRGGGRVRYISADWHEIEVKISLNWQTRNYVGSVFGGSIYAAIDPVYMLQLIMILGPTYVVWDKAASIQFKLPVRETIYARFKLDESIINQIKTQVTANGKYIIDLPVNLYNAAENILYASVTKQLYIASKDYYQKSLARKANAE